MLPKCLNDLLAAFTDQHRTLTVHHNRATSEIPLYQIYYLESALRQIDIYGDIPHRPICTFTASWPSCPPCFMRMVFAGEPQRCGEHEPCAQHPQL